MRYPFVLLLSCSAVCAQTCQIPSDRANLTKPAQKHLLADGFEGTTTKPIDPPDPIAEQPCTVVLEKFPATTVPTVWTDKGNGCDYLVKGRLLFENIVKIEPGVHVRFEKDAILVLEDGGSLIAVGTANKRIVFEGVTHQPGFWSGIRIRGEKQNKKHSRMEYVDVRDAGHIPQNGQAGYFGINSAIKVRDAQVTFKYSTVANSITDGLWIRSSTFTAFENNAFCNNKGVGVSIETINVNELDQASDYVGTPANRSPYIEINSDGGDYHAQKWSKYPVPFYVSTIINVESGTLAFDPGTELLFGEKNALWATENGKIHAIGTKDAPIKFLGVAPNAGWWAGIRFGTKGNVLRHVEVAHAGNTDSLSEASNISIQNRAIVMLDNVLSRDSKKYGIYCPDPKYHDYELVINSLTFDNNKKGDKSPHCPK